MNKQTNKVFVNPNIERLKAIENPRNVVLKLFFQRLGSKVFHAEFAKADNTIRTMAAKIGVTKGVLGLKTQPDKEHILKVYEINKQQFRSINLNNLRFVKCGKVVLEVNSCVK